MTDTLTTLVQLTCDRDHPPTFVRDGDDFSSYIPCPWCVADDAWERAHAFEHARNLRRHRRHPGASTRLARWLASWAYRLGACGKCLPCPDCGTTAADHYCPNGADQ